VKVNTYLGIALGALEAAQIYTRTETRPWITAGIDRATRDPFILRRYGEYWSQLQAAIVLADEAAEIIQTFAAKGNALTANERAAAMVAVFTAKAYVTQVGIPITSQIFETLGSRATARQYGFDRYWRDLRVFTLHDPVSYKVQAIGDWTLNRTHPPATAYS
jgi:alkylation response protein AidB-like acyl-CoA dehydrogenase